MKNKVFFIPIEKLQPSQLYVSHKKIMKNKEWLLNTEINYDAIPIVELNQKMVMTDGHTRAVLLSQLGAEQIKVIWDDDDLDLDAYLECVKWCENESVNSIKDLAHRVIADEDYLKLWIGKCQEICETAAA